MVENEEFLDHGVALVGLHQTEKRVAVEGAVDRCDDREGLFAIEQVGIAHRRLFVHSENLGLLHHLTEVAQLRIRLELLPKGGVGPLDLRIHVVLIPVGAPIEEADSAERADDMFVIHHRDS